MAVILLSSNWRLKYAASVTWAPSCILGCGWSKRWGMPERGRERRAGANESSCFYMDLIGPDSDCLGCSCSLCTPACREEGHSVRATHDSWEFSFPFTDFFFLRLNRISTNIQAEAKDRFYGNCRRAWRNSAAAHENPHKKVLKTITQEAALSTFKASLWRKSCF